MSAENKDYFAINKAVDCEPVYMGVKGSFIRYLVVGSLILFLIFLVLMMIGVHVLITLSLLFGGEAYFIITLRNITKKHGLYGLGKLQARKKQPKKLVLDDYYWRKLRNR